MQKGGRGPLEIDAAIPQHQHAGRCSGRGISGRFLSAAISIEINADEPAALGIEPKTGQPKRILHAMSRQQRSDSLQVAASQHQRDDRLRSYRIEPGSRRIVEHQRRPVDQRAGNGNAPAHTPESSAGY